MIAFLVKTKKGGGPGPGRMPLVIVVLVSLLLGTVEVSAAPLENGEHPEEMVTRCIIEVLSNALAKPNAPPIDPECKEILKKSSRQHNHDEKDNEVKQYETRNLKELTNIDKKQHEISEETKKNPETKILIDQNDEKRHHVGSESREGKEEEEKEEREKNHSKDEEDIGHSKEKHFVEDEEEERENDHSKNEDIIKKDKTQHGDSQETRHDIFDKKIHTADKSVEEFSEEEEEPRNEEEKMKRHHANKNWKEHLGHPGEHHLAHSHEESEESDESQDEEEKRSYQPKHIELGQRFHGYEEKRSHHSEQRHNIDSNEINEEQADYREKKSHFGLNALEDHINKNDKQSHHKSHSFEESREKRYFHRGSEEDREHSEKESKGHHFEEEEDTKYHDERKRWPNSRNDNARFHYEQSNEDSSESEEDIEKRHAREKLQAKERHHFQDSEEEPHKYEAKEEDKKHYIGEEMVDEYKRYYPGQSEEKIKRQFGEEVRDRHYGESKEKLGELNYLDIGKYKPHHAQEKRLENQYGLSDDQIKWKPRYFNKDNSDSDEENKRSLSNTEVFPEYSDYDWWVKRQLLDDMNRGYGEKKSQPKMHKLDIKRQYDRMDELAQLLNYKKKSVEFPDFYDSGEIKKRHFNERGSLSQRPLTDEEEKELENLAIMDLELQKIAEKLSNNRQG